MKILKLCRGIDQTGQEPLEVIIPEESIRCIVTDQYSVEVKVTSQLYKDIMETWDQESDKPLGPHDFIQTLMMGQITIAETAIVHTLIATGAVHYKLTDGSAVFACYNMVETCYHTVATEMCNDTFKTRQVR